MSNGSVNKVILVGNLGSEPVVYDVSPDNAVTRITLATTFFWKDKNTKESKNKTEWHRVVFYGRLAEVAKKYLHKGMKVYVEGSLTTNVWEDKNGVKRSNIEVSATNLQMLTPRGGLSVAHKSEDTTVSEENDCDDLPF